MDNPHDNSGVPFDQQTDHRERLLAKTLAIFEDARTPADPAGHSEIDIGEVAQRLRHMLEEGERRG